MIQIIQRNPKRSLCVERLQNVEDIQGLSNTERNADVLFISSVSEHLQRELLSNHWPKWRSTLMAATATDHQRSSK